MQASDPDMQRDSEIVSTLPDMQSNEDKILPLTAFPWI